MTSDYILKIFYGSFVLMSEFFIREI